MKRLIIATALAGLALSGTTWADERGKEARKAYEEAQREYWKDRREAQKEFEKDRREAEKEYWKDRREDDKEYRKARREAWKDRDEDYRRWARGEHISRDYLYDRYYVHDHRAYDLAPPPRGYMWVRPYEDDDTYYMVQLATGLITQIFGD